MTRTTAREIAIALSFFAAAGDESVDECMERFFEPEHYVTMAAENPVFSELPDQRQMDYIRQVVTLVAQHRDALDADIERYAKGWKTSRISRTAAAILRCAMCEIRWVEDVPTGAAIIEAVELAKKYEAEDVVAFVNGILGGFVRGELPRQTEE